MSNIIFPLQTSFLDYADNESLAVIVYMMGCIHNCQKCQNTYFSNKNYINSVSIDDKTLLKEIKKSCNKNRTNKVVLEGGDPLYDSNFKTTQFILNSNFDIMIYTGYDVSYVKSKGLKGFKYIKCGKYDDSLKQLSEKNDNKMTFASKNQKLFNANLELISNNGVFYFNG